MGHEVRYAARRLVRSPAFTIAAVLTLALAIGANTSIFAVVERVLLNPLPYLDSDRLLYLDHGATTGSGRSVAGGIQMSAGLYYHYLDRARTIDGVALYRTAEQTLTDAGEPERIRIARVTPSLGSVMQVLPIGGRWFTANEGAPAPITTPAPQVVSQTAVLSYRIWMRRYGGDRSLVSRTVLLDGVPTEVVGIMPAQFAFPDGRVDVWIPEQVRREPVWDTFMHAGVARLRGDATVEDARRELSGLIADLPNVYPNDPVVRGFLHNLGLRSAAQTLKEATVGRVASALWIVLASVGVVLLVACANVTNLFLVRSESRQRDIAVRRALGAGRGDIARYFLAESVWLGAAGAGVGLLMASAGVRLLVRFGPDTLPRLGEVQLDWIAIAFNVAVSAIAALLFGTMPLLRRSSLAHELHQGGRTIANRGGHLARHTLMGAQVALALVLLVASGLLVRSFQSLRAIDPAFDPRSALSFRIGLPATGYPRQPGITATHQAILDRLATLPGVTGVTASTCLPLAEGGNGFTSMMRVQGRVLPPGTLSPATGFCAVSARYFETMGTAVIRGRAIDRDDVERLQPVAVVNQALVNAYFGAEDPIGRRVTIGPPRNTLWLTIVGVVRNTPVRALAEPTPMPQVFLPLTIARAGDLPVGPDVGVMSYVVRSATEPTSLLSSVRRALKTVDQDLALSQVRTLQDVLDRSSAQAAFTMTLLAIAAVVAMVLSASASMALS
jgi:predicted permease